MTTTRVRQHRSTKAYGFKAVAGEPEGTFEAYVSVFDNVDFANERVVFGAFDGSLKRWRDSGDPIPVIFSHQWDDLDAHVGIVLAAEERPAGHPELPPELAELGGLWIKGKLDVEEDFAGRLWKRMDRRSLREFSFAYDVLKAKPGADGALDLLELDLIEVGPTLKGMNPATVLVAAKAGAIGHVGKALAALDALDLADTLLEDLADVGEKRLPTAAVPAGAIEPVLAAIHDSATIWAELEAGRDFYWLHLEATMLDEDRAIVTLERWQDPLGEGILYELAFTRNADGTVTIDDATELAVSVELAEKRAERAAADLKRVGRLGRKLANAAAGGDGAATVDHVSSGKAEERPGAKADDQPGDDDNVGDEDLLDAARLIEVELDIL